MSTDIKTYKIEVSLWRNGQGFDVRLSTQAYQTICLTWGEFKVLKKLLKELKK